MTLITPIIHDNGTPLETLIEQRLASKLALFDAILELSKMRPSEPDYTSHRDWVAAMDEHDERVATIVKMIDELDKEVQAIMTQGT